MPLHIIRQDITKMEVDAIVNTTNYEMVGYSGVDFAIHKGAGIELDIECGKIAPLGLGCAKITKGYNLDAKYIIHTSGPVWQGGYAGESIILKSCYLECLKLAVENNCQSVAFPLISAGTYGYPKDQVLKFAIQVITEFLFENELEVYICVFDRTSYEFSKKLFYEINELINDDYVEDNQGDIFDDICRECSPLPTQTASFAKKPKRRLLQGRKSKSSNSLQEYVKSLDKSSNSLQEYVKSLDKSFAYKLFDWIDKREMTDIECYKKANVSKKTFSKIKCNPDTYKPSKPTAVAFAIALRLNLEETQDLLASAGLTLSTSFAFDKIIRYFIQNGVYDIFEINEALFEFDQVLLGS